MFARLMYFDGPRSAELVAAAERAGRERIAPAVEADEQLRDELVALFACRREDGGEVVVSVTRSEAGMARLTDVAMSTELLPGEDPALLQGPDRIDLMPVVDAHIWAGVST